MDDETPQERQDNELEALKAIFGDDVQDVRQYVWKKWEPLNILMTIYPLHDSRNAGTHCKITLRFQCCNNYPDRPPIIKCEKFEGLSNDNVTELLSQLTELSQTLCGEVMIFQLAQHTQLYLHEHNKPISPSISCYQQMIIDKNELERIRLQEQQAKEDAERQKLQDEIERRQQLLREAGRQTSLHGRGSGQSDADDTNDGQNDAPRLICFANEAAPLAARRRRSGSREPPCTCRARGALTLRVTHKNNRKVHISKCLGHSSNGSTTYLAIEETGEFLVVKKWLLPPDTDFAARARQMTSLQQDLRLTQRIKHKHLVPYTAMETTKEQANGQTRQCVYVFRDFVLGRPLKFMREQLVKLKSEDETYRVVRHIGLGVFRALQELHGSSAAHRDVRGANVFLDDSGEVRLAGVALDCRLAEMYEGGDYCDRQTQAQDIYAAGLLLMCLLNNGSEENTHEIPPNLPWIIKDFFMRCVTEDENTQWTAEQLVTHKFLVDSPLEQPLDPHREGSGSEYEAMKAELGAASNGSVRLNAEFDIIVSLGAGAFGDVVKVRNKLDGCMYAIKRVKLNPKNYRMNRKLTREVKLLSSVNHENIVRYYNAWIEAVYDDAPAPTPTPAPAPTPTPAPAPTRAPTRPASGAVVEWSLSQRPVQRRDPPDDSDDDDNDASDDDDDVQFIPNSSGGSDDWVQFASNGSGGRGPKAPSEPEPDPPPAARARKIAQILYIQMELCERNTLRHAIDAHLHRDAFRAWRLFRELVQGVGHVHRRGMIHRDLKPANIFLDSNDMVKIGDFGLATMAHNAVPLDEKAKQSVDAGDPLTGHIGTALYTAPEINKVDGPIYNQKVDIYSLGIILFEMFHKPMETAMERISVLSNLRKKEIILPKEFEENPNMEKQVLLIRWLLNHEDSCRPTCTALLASEHLPRSVSKYMVSGFVAHVVGDPKGRDYQTLMEACMERRITAAEDYTYNQGLKPKPLRLLTALKDAVVQVFQRHGAVEFAPPLMVPRGEAPRRGWAEPRARAVRVMTAAGYVCHLPQDLRLPFARHVAYSRVSHMRRYAVERVFRQRHAAFHPREMLECAFDVVTPAAASRTPWTDAEVLAVAARAAAAAGLRAAVRLNHTRLLGALLLAGGVPRDRLHDVYRVLFDSSSGHITKLQLQTHLTSLCVSPSDVNDLLDMMKIERPVSDLRSLVMSKVKQDKWGQTVEQAISDLEAVYDCAVALGCECPITAAPLMPHNASQHSGVFWQMCAERERAARRPGDVIAVGGRYDNLVAEFHRVCAGAAGGDAGAAPRAVGFSMALERAAALLEADAALPPSVNSVEKSLVCVCVSDTVGNGREGQAAARRAQLARELWAAGLACCVWDASASDALELRDATVVLELEGHAVRAGVWTHDKTLRTHVVKYSDVIDFVKQKLHEVNKSSEGSSGGGRSASVGHGEERAGGLTAVVTYVADEKINKTLKRSCELQIQSQLSSTLSALGAGAARARAHVLALPLEGAPLRALAARLGAPLDAADLPAAFREVAHNYSKRSKILDDALEELTSLVKNQSRSSDETVLYALYSIPDSLCRLIT